MNETIVNNFNSVLKEDDILYILGDLMLEDNDNGILLLNRINCNKKIILGNHDTPRRAEMYHRQKKTEVIGYCEMLKKGKKIFYLSHYPMIVDNGGDNTPIFNLFGHTHQKENTMYNGNWKNYNVGVDAHNCFPIAFEDVITEIYDNKRRDKNGIETT